MADRKLVDHLLGMVRAADRLSTGAPEISMKQLAEKEAAFSGLAERLRGETRALLDRLESEETAGKLHAVFRTTRNGNPDLVEAVGNRGECGNNRLEFGTTASSVTFGLSFADWRTEPCPVMRITAWESRSSRPLANARLKVSEPGGTWNTKTDREGAFPLFLKKEGDYSVVVERNRRPVACVRITLLPERRRK